RAPDGEPQAARGAAGPRDHQPRPGCLAPCPGALLPRQRRDPETRRDAVGDRVMTGPSKTEAEQLAFFEEAHARFVDARKAAGRVECDYRVAGTTVRLCFAGDRLVPHLAPALEHLRIPAVECPELTLCLWDSQSTGVKMPPPPCERESFTDRGDIWGFDSRRIKTAFHFSDYSVNLLDHDRRLGIYWVSKAANLPYWVRASPLRT